MRSCDNRLFLQIVALLAMLLRNLNRILVPFADTAVPTEAASRRGSAYPLADFFESCQLRAAFPNMPQRYLRKNDVVIGTPCILSDCCHATQTS
ncbi:hypothetical protein D3C84_1009060 [compost metagenome]